MDHTPIKILLADPHFLSREGLKSLINSYSGFELIRELHSPDDIVRSVFLLKPDIVIIDYAEPDRFTIDHIKQIKQTCKETGILVISSDCRRDRIKEIFELGIHGFLTKECDQAEIIDAIIACSKKERFVCQRILDLLLLSKNNGSLCEGSRLTEREVEIVTLIASGYTTKEIAKKLYLSHHTVNAHRKNILRKLNARTTSEVVLFAVNSGLVQAGNN